MKFDPNRTIPVYTTRGDCEAYVVFPMIYNPLGEWIGWLTPEKEVFSVHGDYVGWITPEPRILRKRTDDFSRPKSQPPTKPPNLRTPATVPLPPMMAELPYDTIDVLADEPERLPTLDTGEALLDMD
ncbi:MAG: hypothetical protein OEV06_03115 [Anaerolineae bacterium]|nr:hypothetical protein [Anaerolineae bacterium]